MYISKCQHDTSRLDGCRRDSGLSSQNSEIHSTRGMNTCQCARQDWAQVQRHDSLGEDIDVFAS